MQIDWIFISGMMLGIEFVSDDYYHYIALDLLIVRLLFITENN